MMIDIMKLIIIELQTMLLKLTMLNMMMINATLTTISLKKMMRKRNSIPTNRVRDIFGIQWQIPETTEPLVGRYPQFKDIVGL